MKRLIFLLSAVAGLALAQPQPGQVWVSTNTVPSGPCAVTFGYLVQPAGTLYTCQSGTWAQAGASGSGLTNFPDVRVSYAANCVNSQAGSAWDTTLAPACVAGSNNLGGILPFVDTSAAQFKWEIPGDWSTPTQPYIAVHFSSGSNTSGTVIFTVAVACTKADGSVTWDPAFQTADALATKTMTAANREWAASIQMTQLTSGNNCVPGGWAMIKITRSTDTAASAVNVDMAVITTPRNTVFQAN